MKAGPSAATLPLESAPPARGSRWYLAGICLVASLGGFLFGFDTAVISGTFEFVEKLFSLSKFQVGWFGSSALVGCIVGAALVGMLSDRFGRKPNLLVASVFLFVSALYSTIPPNFDVLTWARLIGGVGVGMASVLAPMYISEFAPPKWRGRLVTLYQLSIVLGILAAYFSNWVLLGFSRANPEAFGGQGWLHWTLVAEVWRGMFGAEMIPAAAFFFLLFLVPESPRWLAKAGRDGQAFAVLTRVDGAELARRELTEIQQSIRDETGTLAELFRPGLRMALVVAVGLSVFGQLTGVNIVVYYGPTVLQGAGFASASALQWQVVLGIVNLLFTLVAIWKVDRWGRRPLLVWGMAVVTLALAATAWLLFLEARAGWVVALLCVYMGFVSVSICGVIWVLSPEIFPNRVRGRAMSIATFANWTTNMISAFLFPWYVDRFGIHTGFFTFAAICAVATVFFWRCVPETKGKSLEEIARHWLT
jgi:SP family arabinose:H+ symporter-like MFS transporter